jgi:eukaryotic-like serine/threonine-protein kinase
MQPTQNTRNLSGLSPRVAGTATQATESIHRLPAPSLIGIWRLGKLLYASQHSRLYAAQPADSDGNPRFDYVVRTVSESRETRVESVAQIERFALAASVASHPNLIVVLDSSVQAANPFLVMPKLSGASLRHGMAGVRQPLPVVLWAVRQAAQGLAALHAASWVHGDIKPENLLISEQGHVTVLDLGFAKQVGTPVQGPFMGTPRYAAPELVSERAITFSTAADVFSLGQVLFELLAWCGPTIKNQAAIEPVADLITEMIDDNELARPSAQQIASKLLRLEIETLGEHIQPEPLPARRAA